MRHITADLIRRVELFYSAFNAARFGALRDLPSNPYAVELRAFGNAIAVKNRSPQLRGKQGVTGFCASDAVHLDELLAWYREDGLRCAVHVRHGEVSESLFRRLAAAGMISLGSGTAAAWMDPAEAPPAPAGVTVRQSGADERELYLDIFGQSFAHRPEGDVGYRPIQWAEDSLPEGKRYIAELDGRPVGFGSMPVIDGIAVCATAGTLPAFRGRGIQQCLLRRRIEDAQELGCSLLLGGANLGSTAQRNFTRCGFRMLPQGMNWVDAGTGASSVA